MDSTILKPVPLLLLVAYVAKLAVFGATQPDALIVAFLCGLSAVAYKHDSNKYKDEVQAKFKTLQDQLDKQKVDMEFQKTEVDAAKSYVASMKLSTQMRPKQI